MNRFHANFSLLTNCLLLIVSCPVTILIEITTADHWYMLMQPTRYKREDMTYELIVGNDTIVTPTYDPHCLNDVTAGCEPIVIISAERLVKQDTGPAEGRKIAQALEGLNGVEDFLIPADAYQCIWEELILKKKGVKTFLDREGIEERDYNFSEEMLEEMIAELNRVIIKYSGPKWNSMETANYVEELLTEHKALIESELDDVRSGRRRLTNEDFLGPKTRKAMKLAGETSFLE